MPLNQTDLFREKLRLIIWIECCPATNSRGAERRTFHDVVSLLFLHLLILKVMKRNPPASFSTKSSRRKRKTIICQAMANSRLWLCPHRSLTFAEAKKMLLCRPPDAQDRYTGFPGVCANTSCDISNWVIHRLGTSPSVQLRTWILLFELVDCDDPLRAIRQHVTTDRVNLALSKLDILICGHLELSDTVVSKRIATSYMQPKRREEPEEKLLIQHNTDCSACRAQGDPTEVCVAYRHCVEGEKKVLYVEVNTLRDLGSFDSTRHPTWMCHKVQEEELPALLANWEEWMEFMEVQRAEVAERQRRRKGQTSAWPITQSVEWRSRITNLLEPWFGA